MARNAEVVRQWNILRELEASRSGTIDGLAEKCRVSTRTMRCDLDPLQEAGFALFDEHVDGKTGPWASRRCCTVVVLNS